MKRYLYMQCLALVLLSTPSLAQKTDTTVSIKVSGVCGLCKERIENAIKIKPVKMASWDIDSKMLSVTYDAAKISLSKVENLIVAVGHDIGDKKASADIYEALPACCHYRELDKAAADSMNHAGTPSANDAIPVRGVVLEEDHKGGFVPLEGATVQWLGTNAGTMSNKEGIFSILPTENSSRLVISYTGYGSDTISIGANREIRIVMASDKKLSEVIVNARQRTSFVSGLTTIRTQVMTEKELFKAACCNLSESFETNPSVDVSYNDAVTGSKQIQLLGLSGIYTQLTVENLPGPRGLATPWGLNAIPGPWVESIQLTKGIGSVANGYESIAGQINVELKKPLSEKLFANVYVNDQGKTDLNLNLSGKAGKNWSTALLVHDDFLNNHGLDLNKDGFRDLPTGNQFSMMNRWKFEANGWIVQFLAKYLDDHKTGGETSFDPDKERLSSTHYGLGINTKRWEGSGKIGYVFPAKKYKSIGLQLDWVDHDQDAYFGLRTYNASQQYFYANLLYQSIIGTTAHKFRAGLSFLDDHYNELINATIFKRKEIVPGAFFEYTYTPNTKFSAVLGLRADDHNLYGWFLTPRIHLRYEPVKGTTIRMSAGRGQRTANIFAENIGIFVSSRAIQVIPGNNNGAYGLRPEIAWNKGMSIDQKIKLFRHDATVSVDYFRNDFSNQVIADIEDPSRALFYDLKGVSRSNSFQLELNMEPVKLLDIRLAYRYFDVKANYNGRLLSRPLLAAHRAFMNAAYNWLKWKFDLTLNYTGPKRLPSTASNPVEYRLPPHSPSYLLANAQVSRTIGKKHPAELYLGAENIGNYYQHNSIIAASQPFNPYFDAGLVWGPITGRMFYAGMRFKLK